MCHHTIDTNCLAEHMKQLVVHPLHCGTQLNCLRVYPLHLDVYTEIVRICVAKSQYLAALSSGSNNY